MEVQAAGEGIRASQEVAWDMDDLEIKVSEVKQPLGLTTVYVLGLTEVCQVLMISKDLDGEGGSVKIVSLGFQSMDDHEEFPIIDVIVSFGRDERLREVGIGVSVAV